MNLTRAFSALIFWSLSNTFVFEGLKKGESGFCLASWVYGRFLSVKTASTAPIMIMTIITAAIPNSRLPVDASPVTGEGYGDAVGAGVPA